MALIKEFCSEGWKLGGRQEGGWRGPRGAYYFFKIGDIIIWLKADR